MSAPRQQEIPGVAPFTDGSTTALNQGNPFGFTSDASVTLGRHTLFGTLSMIGADGRIGNTVGGMQAFSVEEINNTQFRAMAGNDWLEPVVGMRMWQGEGSRFQLRGGDIQEMLSKRYGGSEAGGDIDFRFMPFIWRYNYVYAAPFTSTGNSNALAYETASWQWMTVFITRYRWSFQDPMSLLSEDFSFIGKGYNRSDGQKFKFGNLGVLWGSSQYGTSGQADANPSEIKQTGG